MFELRLLAPEAAIEPISDALEALDALSVSVEDADAHTAHEQALFGEPGMPVEREGWQRSLLTALFAQEADAQEAARLLALQDFFAGSQVLAVEAVPEQDWVRLTQSQFAPVEVTPDFWIVPTWHDVPVQARHSIRLDPGLAFGTGSHPTTLMCLRWLARQPHLQTARVLDYGCGSGILAVAAAKLGAIDIDAVDIDPAAVEATRSNAASNNVTVRSGLPDMADPAQGHYDVVLANILAAPLKVLAPLLCAHLAPGGHLVLAGMLQRQEAELQEVYASNGLGLQVVDQQDGWLLMHGQRGL
ncbi:MAG: 50S ribosomal protein L11 methyltransferase [Brachymonas sp.]|nr:50S ribosomal protein L11 methyltransferase [Brachymonas sp.]